MPGSAGRHRHRHYKTLIALVFCMTSGTILLYWVGRLSPVTPLVSLRGNVPTPVAWERVQVRTAPLDQSGAFWHFRIDAAGLVSQSSAWTEGQHDPRARGTIQVIISGNLLDARVTSLQSQRLKRLLGFLRSRYGDLDVKAS